MTNGPIHVETDNDFNQEMAKAAAKVINNYYIVHLKQFVIVVVHH